MSAAVRSALGLLGSILLLHSGYSAYESLSYEKSLDPSSSLEIPLDIQVETILSVALLCVAVVLSSADLKPVKWREWATLQENETPGLANLLEHRPGFVDIRAKRKAFLEKKKS